MSAYIFYRRIHSVRKLRLGNFEQPFADVLFRLSERRKVYMVGVHIVRDAYDVGRLLHVLQDNGHGLFKPVPVGIRRTARYDDRVHCQQTDGLLHKRSFIQERMSVILPPSQGLEYPCTDAGFEVKRFHGGVVHTDRTVSSAGNRFEMGVEGNPVSHDKRNHVRMVL